MDAILDVLNTQAFSIGSTPVYVVELVGFVLGVMNLWLLTRQNILNFPIGIAMVSVFFLVFLNAKLYADMWLQVFFIVVQFFGWWAWLKAGPNRTELKVRNTNWWIVAGTTILVVALIIWLKPILHNAHGAYPIWDATSTSLSIGAQILLSFKILENWYMWIVADLIYIPVYFLKDLYFTSILYIIFLGLCFVGLNEWHKAKSRLDTEIEIEPAQVAAVEGATA
jgi:nicotinamide mononucleotide transporter